MSMLQGHLGELAALGAALCWVFTSLAFAAAGRRVGSTAVNIIRIFIALLVLGAIHRAVFGAWWPQIDQRGILLLAASGVIGLAIGDQFLFTAFVDIGPRLSVLLMTVAPPITAVLAWPLLSEKLGWIQVFGIALTLGGIAWVVLERPESQPPPGTTSRRYGRGIAFSACGGACQAVGLVLSKLGMGHGSAVETLRVGPWSATLVRMTFAAIAISLLVPLIMTVRRGDGSEPIIEISPEFEHLPPPRMTSRQRMLAFALLMICIGVVFGPVLGVWCSMVAVDRAEAGIAATLMAMTPVFVLPFAVWIEKERISWRAAIGAGIAVLGVAVLTAGGFWLEKLHVVLGAT